MMNEKPTHVYIARKRDCGCVTGLTSDDMDDPKGVAEFVADCIKSGRFIERVTWEQYYDEIRHELGFMNCRHGQLSLF